MSLYEHLMENRDKAELAKELAASARKIADLENQIDALKHDLFWSNETGERLREKEDAERYRRIRSCYHVQFKDGKFLNLNAVVSEDWGKQIDKEIDRLRGVSK